MITLVMIVGHKLCDRVPKRCLSEEDHSAQTFFLYGTDKSLRERADVHGRFTEGFQTADYAVRHNSRSVNIHRQDAFPTGHRTSIALGEGNG
jgi:hypothetical protein